MGRSSSRGVARETVHEVPTSHGLARVTYASPARPIGDLFLLHGAGGGIDAPDLVRVAELCHRAGLRVGRVEQPYRVARKPIGSNREKLDGAFTELVERQRLGGLPLFLGGRSAGARCACRTAEHLDASAVVALAFPLHPPHQPEKTRVGELVVSRPMLVVQGTRDAFGGPSEFPPGTRVHVVEGADHSFRVLRSSGRSDSAVIDEVAENARDFVLSFMGS